MVRINYPLKTASCGVDKTLIKKGNCGADSLHRLANPGLIDPILILVFLIFNLLYACTYCGQIDRAGKSHFLSITAQSKGSANIIYVFFE